MDDLAGVYKDADGSLFVLRRLSDNSYQMVWDGGSRYTSIDAEDAARLVSHSTKQDRDDPWR